MSSNKAQGKSKDLSTEWSDYMCDEADGTRYVRTRLDPSGQPEYDFAYPAGSSSSEVPRSAGPNVLNNPGQSYTTSYGYSNANTQGLVYDTSSYSAIPQSSASRSGGYYPYDTAATSTYSPVATSRYTTTGLNTSTDWRGSSQVATPRNLGEGGGRCPFGTPTTTPKDGGLSSYIKRAPGSQDIEELDPRYRVVPVHNQKKFWKQGRVFIMLWTEPARDDIDQTRNGTHYSRTYLNTGAYSEIRRFVVIREGYGNSICSPIHTYNGQATLKSNLPGPLEHAIIYTSKECPEEVFYKATNGTIVRENLTKLPIKVRSLEKGPEGQLDPKSRINYGKLYTVEHYVRVLNIGMVEKDYLAHLYSNCMVRPAEPQLQKPVERPPPEGSLDEHDDRGKHKSSDRGKHSGRKHSDRGESSRHHHSRK